MEEPDEVTIIKGLVETLGAIRKTNLITQKNILLEQREMKEIYKHIYSELRKQNELLKTRRVIDVKK